MKGKVDQARASLLYLRDPPSDISNGSSTSSSDYVSDELNAIKASIDELEEAKVSWTVLFTDRSMFNRLWRAALLHFMAQMCGNTSIKYYLPGIFIDLGLGRQLSLMVGGIESTLKIGCTIIEMMIIDRVGRRTTLIIGSAIMSSSLLVCYYSSQILFHI